MNLGESADGGSGYATPELLAACTDLTAWLRVPNKSTMALLQRSIYGTLLLSLPLPLTAAAAPLPGLPACSGS